MNFDDRNRITKIAEAAVNRKLTNKGWLVSVSQLRDGFSDSHNNALAGLFDRMSLFIRHFPDHVATKNETILVQTKRAGHIDPKTNAPYEKFVMEKDCADMFTFYPFPQSILVVYWIEETNTFLAAFADDVIRMIMNQSAIPASGRGSTTSFYLLRRDDFDDLDSLLNKIERRFYEKS